MPELPEVETIRRQLAPELEGRRLDRMEILDPRWSEPAPPEEVAQAVEGRRIERLDDQVRNCARFGFVAGKTHDMRRIIRREPFEHERD